jgi:hypothetical protein
MEGRAMNSNPRKSASAKQLRNKGFYFERVAFIGELIVHEAARLARVSERIQNREPLERMRWIIEDAMEQVYNQLGYLKYSLHLKDKKTMTDQNGGQGDE